MTDHTDHDTTPVPRATMLAKALTLEGIALSVGRPELALDRLRRHEFGELPTLAAVLEIALQGRVTALRRAADDSDLPGGLHDQARQARWERDPGAPLPGAETARFFRRPPPRFGYVTHEGQLYPWTYVSGSYAASDLNELATFAKTEKHHRGIAVCSPLTAAMLREEAMLPAGYLAVAVELDRRG